MPRLAPLTSASIKIVLLCSLAAVPGHAQTTAPAAALGAGTIQPAPAVRTNNSFSYRQTLEQRFASANVTKDGKLTQPQAFAARWSYATRNFDAIDTTHSGIITIDQIRKFARDRRAARQLQDQQQQQQTNQPAVRTQSPG